MRNSELARAKINLALHVTGRRDDGYHLLDSIVTFANYGDRITVRRAAETSLNISGPFAQALAETGDNIVLRALSLFDPDIRVQIDLEKNLPVASGMGGGSADAAAVLRAVARLCGVPLPADDQVLRLGADVPVCLMQQPVRMQGIGDVLTPLDLPELHAVLVNPGVGVATGPVFEALESPDNQAIGVAAPDLTDARGTIAWLKSLRNDLQPDAITQAPVIEDVLAALREAGADLARMSGSGATCFGLFEDSAAATRAADSLKEEHPRWWVCPTVLQAARDIT
jgi:4-diphosphocytidyl-2-C-methyl-D-erythritol kinase